MKPFRFLLSSLLFSCATANAADIWHKPEGQPGIGVVVEGEIVPGDFQRLQSLLRDKGPYVERVYLYSPGGEAREAMKIGRMLRTLQITTEAPGRTSKLVGDDIKSFAQCTFTKPRKQENCVCYSSCYLAWIAGIDRAGHWLGVHRPRFKEEYFASLSATAAQVEYNNMMKDVESYLSQYMVPQRVKEKMMTTPSHEIYILDHGEVFPGFVASYDELLSARCGAFPEELAGKLRLLQYRQRQNKISSDEIAQLTVLEKQSWENMVCRGYQYIVMRVDAFSKYFGIDYWSRIRAAEK